MIVGICIGSGIFFKVDDILSFTGGNVLLGTMIFIIGALAIIFGSISLTSLSVRTTNSGGMVGYFEAFFSNKMASAFGWFQTFLYYPTIAVVVSWAAGIYTCMLFGLDNTLNMQMLLGLGYLLLFYAINILSVKAGGYFQVLSTVTKLIPLIGIGLLGFFWTKEAPPIPEGVAVKELTDVGWGWLAALAPAAFSYDGWPIALSITNEVKNPKRNMPLALVIGPLVVLVVYLAYFLGMNAILGPQFIISTGDDAVMTLGYMLFGELGSTILLIFVLIAILGVVNGVLLGHLRMPQALASKGLIPDAERIRQIDLKRSLSMPSAKVSVVCSLFWYAVHYVTQLTGIMAPGDVSEIAIVFGYACYFLLYVKVMQLYRQKDITNVFLGVIAPLLGMLGSLIIVLGGFLANPLSMSLFAAICFFFCLAGYLYADKHATAAS